jgi:hypothetical protein
MAHNKWHRTDQIFAIKYWIASGKYSLECGENIFSLQ